MKESDIQTKIKKQLEAHGWFVTKLIQTSTNGIPDLLALRNSRAVFIECKRPGYHPTPLQDYVAEKLRKQGFETITAWSTDQVKHLMTRENDTIKSSERIS